jgi:hypothetical protein
VAAVSHYGDTRGQEWYTEVTGIETVENALLMTAGADRNNAQP